MNFLQNIGRTYDLARNNQADYASKDLQNQQHGQTVQSNQNALDAQALSGLLIPFLVQQHQQQAGTPFVPSTQAPNPQTMIPQQAMPSNKANDALSVFGGSVAPNTPTDFRTALDSAPAPQSTGAPAAGPSFTPPQQMPPEPLALPGMARMSQLAQDLQQQGQGYSPAAQFGAFQNYDKVMRPQEQLYNQQVIQDMRGDLVQQRLQNMMDIARMRDETSRANTDARVNTTSRGQDLRVDAAPSDTERDFERASKNFTAMAQAASYMAQGDQPTFEKLVAPYKAEMERANAAMQAARSPTSTKPAAPSVPKAKPAAKAAPAKVPDGSVILPQEMADKPDGTTVPDKAGRMWSKQGNLLVPVR